MARGKGFETCAQGHGLNRVTGSVKKKGGNKGIKAVKQYAKRQEAESRNAKTLPENRRSYRREMEGAANG